MGVGCWTRKILTEFICVALLWIVDVVPIDRILSASFSAPLSQCTIIHLLPEEDDPSVRTRGVPILNLKFNA